MWIILPIICFILLCSVLISILILKTIESQPDWLMGLSLPSSTDNETETSPSGVTTAQSGSTSAWQQGLLNHIQAMGNSEPTPETPSNETTTTKKSKKDKKDKKPTNRFELIDMDE